jgi:4-carboxymuconolactone decarboxylase
MKIHPVEPPYPPEVGDLLTRMMPANAPIPPLALFRTLARHMPLASAMQAMGSYVLGKKADRDRGLPSRIRELVILRTCARCRCEYEWGVHATVFAERVGIAPAEIAATVTGGPAAFAPPDADVIAACDELHDTGAIADATWQALRAGLGEEQLIELCTVAGWYHAIAFVATTAGVSLEPWAARFPTPV